MVVWAVGDEVWAEGARLSTDSRARPPPAPRLRWRRSHSVAWALSPHPELCPIRPRPTTPSPLLCSALLCSLPLSSDSESQPSRVVRVGLRRAHHRLLRPPSLQPRRKCARPLSCALPFGTETRLTVRDSPQSNADQPSSRESPTLLTQLSGAPVEARE